MVERRARERIHGRVGEFQLNTNDANDVDNNVDLETNWADLYDDGKKTYSWSSNDKHSERVNCAIYPRRIMPSFPDIILLRSIILPETDGLRCPTLAQLIASGGVTIRGKQKSKDGDTIWVLEVDEPAPREADDADKKNPTFSRIYVDADKGFLVSRVATHLSRTGPPAEGHDFAEVVEFTDCGHGVFFPSTVKREERMPKDRDPPLSDVWQTITISATRLSVNTSLPSDAFGFRFPEHAVVYETVPGGSTRKVMIWGPDNKPIKEFRTEKDFLDSQKQERAKEARRQDEPKYDPKKPTDSYGYGTGAYVPPQQSSTAAEGPHAEAACADGHRPSTSRAGSEDDPPWRLDRHRPCPHPMPTGAARTTASKTARRDSHRSHAVSRPKNRLGGPVSGWPGRNDQAPRLWDGERRRADGARGRAANC